MVSSVARPLQKRGGKVLSAGKDTIDVPGAIAVDVPLKQLWDLGGFEAGGHAQMWQEFNERWREPLETVFAGLEIPYSMFAGEKRLMSCSAVLTVIGVPSASSTAS